MFLRRLGWDPRGWGYGTSPGSPQAHADRLTAHVVDLAAERGPVAVVGWSLGGVISREVARRRPDKVRRRVADLAARTDRDAPWGVPITAVLSRRDDVVAWESCIDRTSTDVEHEEVGSLHLGMGLDPDVWRLVATRLARP